MIYVILDLTEARNKRPDIYYGRKKNHPTEPLVTWVRETLDAKTYNAYYDALHEISQHPVLMQRWTEATIGVSYWNDAQMKPQYLIDGSLMRGSQDV